MGRGPTARARGAALPRGALHGASAHGAVRCLLRDDAQPRRRVGTERRQLTACRCCGQRGAFCTRAGAERPAARPGPGRPGHQARPQSPCEEDAPCHSPTALGARSAPGHAQTGPGPQCASCSLRHEGKELLPQIVSATDVSQYTKGPLGTAQSDGRPAHGMPTSRTYTVTHRQCRSARPGSPWSRAITQLPGQLHSLSVSPPDVPPVWTAPTPCQPLCSLGRRRW